MENQILNMAEPHRSSFERLSGTEPLLHHFELSMSEKLVLGQATHILGFVCEGS